MAGVTECQLLAPRGEASLTGAKISATRDPLDRLIERGCLKRYTKHFLYHTTYIYICIYILYLPYKTYSASTYNSTQPRYILPENLSKHLVRKRRREKKKRKKKRKREIARNFAGLGGNFESTRCEKRKRCCERSVSWKSHISRSKHENRVEKDPRFPSSCSIRIRDERFVVLIVAKKKKEKKRKNCGERVESFSNRFSFFFKNRGIGSNEKDSERRNPVAIVSYLVSKLSAFFLLSFQLIFSGEYTKAMSKDWHSGHFCCWQCDESLTGQRYVLRDEHPYCIKCYESVFANGCEECNKIIGIDSKVRYTSSLFSKCPFLFFFFLLNFLSYVV